MQGPLAMHASAHHIITACSPGERVHTFASMIIGVLHHGLLANSNRRGGGSSHIATVIRLPLTVMTLP
jgi:hypothetical protein